MRTTYAFAALSSLAFVAACSDDPPQDPNSDDLGICLSCGIGSDSDSGDGGGGGDSSGNGAACPLGAPAFTTSLGATDSQQEMSLAVDASGNVLVGAAGRVSGFRTLSNTGDVIASRPFGSLVAIDAEGAAYIAGSFSSPIDLGGGVVLTPMGSSDVFLIKLDANGAVIIAKTLGRCSADLLALTVGDDGRIALSGTGMGTVVLDASGNFVLGLADVGHLAFTSEGNLVIAGTRGTAQAFVRIVDPTGTTIFEHIFPGSATLTGVAVDDTDHIVIIGNTDSTVDLFGMPFTATYDEGVVIAGAFAVKLDAVGNPEFSTQLFLASANAIAIGPDGLPYVAANTRRTGVPEPPTSGALLRIDSSSTVTFFGVASLFSGSYTAIAMDACGYAYLGGAGFQDPAVPVTNALVVKVLP